MRIDVSNNYGLCGVVPECAAWTVVASFSTKLFDKSATNTSGLTEEEVNEYCCSTGYGGGVPTCNPADGCG